MSGNDTIIEHIMAVLHQPVLDFEITHEKSALLLIDFVDRVSSFKRVAAEADMPESETNRVFGDFDTRAKEAANKAGELLMFLREKGFEIFHARSEVPDIKKGTVPKTSIAVGLETPSESGRLEFYDAVKPRKGELVFSQENLDAFSSTNLDFVLRNMKIDTLAICGLTTDQSVLFNTVQAVNLGYRLLLVEDACAALTAEIQATFIRWYKTFVNVKSSKEIIRIIESDLQRPS